MKISKELTQIARSSEVVSNCLSFERSGQLSMGESLDLAVAELAKQYQQLKLALIEKGYDWDKAESESELPIRAVGSFDADCVAKSSLDSETKIKVLWSAMTSVRTIFCLWVAKMPPEPIPISPIA